MHYHSDAELFIDGEWRDAPAGETRHARRGRKPTHPVQHPHSEGEPQSGSITEAGPFRCLLWAWRFTS
ncbi:hypothetical protein GA0061101_1177 [Rhizobium lusitanum]|uniref:Uncharacterized protein n=1 Tax=Rhizobium lusitanum TaxID=293958 RepID=A0A1C3WU05_9HYPH|nr:hypothetical protein GA0061101_1177 [Rhizobium lusitanum]